MKQSAKPVTAPDLIEMKRRGEKIAMLTAYDALMARLLDRAGIDVLLVGDSVGMVLLGHQTTIPVTMDAMVHHTRAVRAGAQRALVVADMPFLACHTGADDAVRRAGRLIQEGGAQAVKIEGGAPVLDAVRRITGAGIPVMGHLGLLPQSVHRLGGFRMQARSGKEAAELLAAAQALEQAGAFAVVLEAVPAGAARAVTQQVSIPTIGIGAGPDCDGQVLVSHDVFGLSEGHVPSFVKQYARLGAALVEAALAYAADVKAGRFPAASAGPEAERVVAP